MNFGTFGNNVVIINTFLFLNEVVRVPILTTAVRRRVPGRRQLDSGNKHPLNQREGDSDDGTYRNENLGAEIWQNCRTHNGINNKQSERQVLSVNGNGVNERNAWGWLSLYNRQKEERWKACGGNDKF